MKPSAADRMEGAAHQLLALTTGLRQAIHVTHAVDHGVTQELDADLIEAAGRLLDAWCEAGSPCGDLGFVVVLADVDSRTT